MKKYMEFLKRIKSIYRKVTIKQVVIWLITILLFFTFTKIFFASNLIIFPDSSGYYLNSLIMLRKIPFSEWFIIRGFGFPLIITIFIVLFGNSMNGLLFGIYLFYILMLIIIGLILKKYLKDNNKKWVFYILFWIMFVFNSIMLGYSHTLLTEAIMPTIYLGSICIFNYWILKKRSNVAFNFMVSVIIILLGILIWFIKQPYYPAYFATLCFSAIIFGINKRSFKEFAKKGILCVLSLICLLFSIMLWNRFSPDQDNAANDYNKMFMSGAILGGNNLYYYKVDDNESCNLDYISNLDNKTQKKLKSFYKKNKDTWCEHFEAYEVYNEKGERSFIELIISEDTTISNFEKIEFLITNIFKHPKLTLASYYHNYLAISDVENRDFSNGYRSNLVIDRYAIGENGSNGIFTYNNTDIVLLDESAFVQHFKNNTKQVNTRLNQYMNILFDLDQSLFRFSMMMVIPALIYSLFLYLKTKRKDAVLPLLIAFMSFINIFFHVFTGAIIDRYIYPVYPLLMLDILLLIIYDSHKEELIEGNSLKNHGVNKKKK